MCIIFDHCRPVCDNSLLAAFCQSRLRLLMNVDPAQPFSPAKLLSRVQLMRLRILRVLPLRHPAGPTKKSAKPLESRSVIYSLKAPAVCTSGVQFNSCYHGATPQHCVTGATAAPATSGWKRAHHQSLLALCWNCSMRWWSYRSHRRCNYSCYTLDCVSYNPVCYTYLLKYTLFHST